MRPSAAQYEIDCEHIGRCLHLADKYLGRTAPNPAVGCVIVGRDGEVLAEGAHRGAGTPHAEIVALRKLKGKARGATLYCNLEPCNHHGRTPPCAPAIREAGVSRVVIGFPDPVRGHGGGIEHLRRAGIAVSVGVMREACERHNVAWLTSMRFGRPSFTLKAAITLDGKICTVTGQAKWITGDWARADVMRLRNQHDAVLVGINTVLADNPWLTSRIKGGRHPARIVIDSQLRTPTDAYLLPKKTGPRTIIACAESAPERREKALVAKGAEIWRLRTHRNGRVDLHALATRIGDEQDGKIHSVLVEGGGEIHEDFLRRRLADELVIYIAPKVVGGPAKSWVGGKGLASLTSAHRFEIDEHVQMLGGDIRITAKRWDAPTREWDGTFDDVDD